MRQCPRGLYAGDKRSDGYRDEAEGWSGDVLLWPSLQHHCQRPGQCDRRPAGGHDVPGPQRERHRHWADYHLHRRRGRDQDSDPRQVHCPGVLRSRGLCCRHQLPDRHGGEQQDLRHDLHPEQEARHRHLRLRRWLHAPGWRAVHRPRWRYRQAGCELCDGYLRHGYHFSAWARQLHRQANERPRGLYPDHFLPDACYGDGRRRYLCDVPPLHSGCRVHRYCWHHHPQSRGRRPVRGYESEHQLEGHLHRQCQRHCWGWPSGARQVSREANPRPRGLSHLHREPDHRGRLRQSPEPHVRQLQAVRHRHWGGCSGKPHQAGQCHLRDLWREQQTGVPWHHGRLRLSLYRHPGRWQVHHQAAGYSRWLHRCRDHQGCHRLLWRADHGRIREQGPHQSRDWAGWFWE